MSSLISRISWSSVSRAGRAAPVVVTVREVSARIALTWRWIWSLVRRSSSVMGCLPRSAEPAGYVVLGELLARVREDLERVAHLDEIARSIVTHREECRAVADPRR